MESLTSPMAVQKRPERVKKIATIQKNTTTATGPKRGHTRNLSDTHMLDSQVQITPRSPTNELNPI